MADANAKKPADTAFKQQRLAAWQPILSPMYVVGCFMLIAVIFIPIGVAVIVASGQVVEVEVPYSNPVCPWNSGTPSNAPTPPKPATPAPTTAAPGPVTPAPVTPAPPPTAAPTPIVVYPGCVKVKDVVIADKMDGPVYMYYKLTNFYQNHRRYAASRWDTQIAGHETTADDVSDQCNPIKMSGSKLISPCGLVAWSMFNDTAVLQDTAGNLLCDTTKFAENGDATDKNMKCKKKGIAWESDRDKKFQKPDSEQSNWITGAGDAKSTDLFLFNGYYPNEAGHKIPLVTDEDLMVWMRIASLPTFRKLWRVFDDGLAKGTYKLTITDRYDISAFSGEKSIVFATTSWIGGKNDFLGVAYLVVGCLCFILSIAFLVKHKMSPSSVADK